MSQVHADCMCPESTGYDSVHTLADSVQPRVCTGALSLSVYLQDQKIKPHIPRRQCFSYAATDWPLGDYQIIIGKPTLGSLVYAWPCFSSGRVFSEYSVHTLDYFGPKNWGLAGH